MLPLVLLKTSQGHPVVRSSFGGRCPSKALWMSSERVLDSEDSKRESTLLPVALLLPPCCSSTRRSMLCYLSQLVELKNGETYNGHMVLCDTWMNIHLREVICTSKVS